MPLWAQQRVFYTSANDPHLDSVISGIESSHISAYVVDSGVCAFPGKEDSVGMCWNSFLEDMSKYLRASGVKWTDTVHVWLRAYFNKDGKTDAILIRVPDSLKNQQLDASLNGFARSEQWHMRSSVPFAQCGSATFLPQ